MAVPPIGNPSLTLQATLTHALFCLVLAGVSAAVVRGMVALGPLDRPDARKAHARPVPKGGGVGVVAAFLLGIGALYAFAEFARIADPYFRGVIVASAAIAIVAFLDDLRDWPFTVKFAAQVGAAGLAVGTGLYVQALNIPWWGTLELGWLGAPLTVVWIVLLTNAVNFMDGLNGLASGVCAIAAGVLAAIAASQGGWFVYFASLLLLAGLAGFLPFNFPRARIFMGDVGSQFCGFVLAVLAVAAGRFEAVELSVLLVPMLLFGVLWDVVFTLVRRLRAGDRLTQAHRSHLYQVAHRTGWDARAVTVLHWAFALWGAACCAAFVAWAPGKPWAALAVVPPQVAWSAYVIRRAQRAGLGKW